jgi:hypothetical protein
MAETLRRLLHISIGHRQVYRFAPMLAAAWATGRCSLALVLLPFAVA